MDSLKEVETENSEPSSIPNEDARDEKTTNM